MKFPILIIRNLMSEYDFSDDVEKFVQWMVRHTPLEPEITYLDTELANLTHKPFKKVGVQTWYGLSDIKDRLRNEVNISKYTYKQIIFLYDFKDAVWNPENPALDTRAGGWTYGNDLFGSAFIEVPIVAEMNPIDDLYRVLSHETIHGYHRLCWWANIPTNDTLDVYDKEFEIEAPDGNRARNLKQVAPFWSTIGSLTLMQQLINLLYSYVPLLQAQVALLQKQKNTMNRIEEWAYAVKDYEGYIKPGEKGPNGMVYPEGSAAYRNNNPGNLRGSKYPHTMVGGFCKFATYDIGWQALVFQLTIACDGRSQVYKPTMSLFDFYRKYAPTGDNNVPDSYALYIASRLKVNPSDPIKNLLGA